MGNKLIAAFISAAFLLSCASSSPAQGTGALSVDFVNRESRSISVAQGKRHGIQAGMNFAVVDSTGAVIADFFPAEIMDDRFWSGTLEKEAFSRVRPGSAVREVTMTPEEARILREASRARSDALKAELARSRAADLRQSLQRMEIDLKAIREEKRRLLLRSQEMKVSLVREKRRQQEEIFRYEDRMDEQYDDLDSLILQREESIYQREALSRQDEPPQEEIDRLTLQVKRINDRITGVHRTISQLREDRRDAWADWYRNEEAGAESDLEIFKVDQKMERLEEERQGIIRELETISR